MQTLEQIPSKSAALDSESAAWGALSVTSKQRYIDHMRDAEQYLRACPGPSAEMAEWLKERHPLLDVRHTLIPVTTSDLIRMFPPTMGDIWQQSIAGRRTFDSDQLKSKRVEPHPSPRGTQLFRKRWLMVAWSPFFDTGIYQGIPLAIAENSATLEEEPISLNWVQTVADRSRSVYCGGVEGLRKDVKKVLEQQMKALANQEAVETAFHYENGRYLAENAKKGPRIFVGGR